MPPMNTHLPKNIDAWQWARKGEYTRTLEGTLEASELNGIRDLVANKSSKVYLIAKFIQDAEGYNVLTGHWTTELTVYCQRCLEPMALSLQAELNLALVIDSKSAQTLPERLDPLVVAPGEMLSIPKLLSEEILLALPIVPKHEESVCVSELAKYSDQNGPSEDAKSNSLAALANLKTN